MSFDKNNLQQNTTKLAKDIKYQAENAAHSAKDNAESAYQNAKSQAESTYNTMKSEVENAYEQVRDKTAQFYEDSKKKAEEVQNYFSEHSDDLIKVVKEKPLTSLLVAGGVGYLLSKLLSK